MRVTLAGIGLVLLVASTAFAQGSSGNASTTGSSSPANGQSISSNQVSSAPPAANQVPVTLYVPDGQLRSHPFRVYVAAKITQANNPSLVLDRSHAATKSLDAEATSLKALDALEVTWTEKVDGHDATRSGSLLLFRIPDEPYFEARPMVRVRPVLHWKDGNVERVATTEGDVNVGDIWRIVAWTALAIGIALATVTILSRQKNASPMQLLAAIDGHLSLAQTQVACWTLAVGAVVLAYGILRQQPPDIPASLIVLMGFSLATGGAGFVGDAKKQQQADTPAQPVAAPPPLSGNPLASVGITLDGAAIHGGTAVAVIPAAATDAAAQQRTWNFGDLVRTFSAGSNPQLSLAKAQMLFWTILLLVLFVSKSIVDGVLWEIPWPLVGLMGVSQAGYVLPKFMPATT
jgi:hypothetical protein